MIRLIENWRHVLRRAWSVKFSIIAAVLASAEVVVAIVQPVGVSGGLFSTAAALVSVGSIVARALAQPEDARAIAERVARELKE